jgi:hypothetical protein
MRYEDKDGNLLGYPAAPDLKTDSDWVTLSAESDIPAGTDHVDVDAGNYGTAGEVAFDDIVVAPIAGTRSRPPRKRRRGKQRTRPFRRANALPGARSRSKRFPRIAGGSCSTAFGNSSRAWRARTSRPPSAGATSACPAVGAPVIARSRSRRWWRPAAGRAGTPGETIRCSRDGTSAR